ncbi:MAG: hypothetical protein EOP08_02955 [Proteobacteria bacterium]|nr:MAG: hypothetical protein EOP08_02955 [Pseudomonadota bacterium]
MSGKHKGDDKGHSSRSLDQTDTQRFQGPKDTPAQGRRSNPGNVEAGIGHTRGHDRPGTNTGGRGRDAED